MPALIDRHMPRFDASERHATRVGAACDVVYRAIGDADLASSLVVRALLVARALPALVAGGSGARRHNFAEAREPFTIRTLERYGFRLLAEDAPSEMLIGLEGEFWRPDGGICTPPPEDFIGTVPPPGRARAVWNFSVAPDGSGRSLLTTETRVLCGGHAARRRFLRYWRVVRPCSGLIRRLMLRSITREAERG
jgi:hypothetical protein